MTTFPTVFLSHGSPMQAIEPGIAGEAWEALGRALPRPRAVLMVSAHWETEMPSVTGAALPETIHDFGGFPAALYRIQYPAPGAPDLAQHIADMLDEAGAEAAVDRRRGLDHGAWVPLKWMYPRADVPVVELSVQPGRTPADHVALGRLLAPLTRDGVLVIGSGHATHNLHDWMTNRRHPESLAYVQEFADWLHGRLEAHDTTSLVAYRSDAPGATRAHPTEEHFLPLHVAWGAADPDSRVERIVHGLEGGALSLDSYVFHPTASA